MLPVMLLLWIIVSLIGVAATVLMILAEVRTGGDYLGVGSGTMPPTRTETVITVPADADGLQLPISDHHLRLVLARDGEQPGQVGRGR
jgi:hypothetical protein